MAEPISIKALTIPISMLASILGGSAWLTTTRSDLNHLTDKVRNHRIEFKESRKQSNTKMQMLSNFERSQDERLARMEGKQDLILKTMQTLERRINK